MAITVLGALVLAPATAQAALTMGLTFPDPVTVGSAGLTANLTLTNTGDAEVAICNQGTCGGGASEGIILISSCGSAATPAPTCSAPDPDVFAVTGAVPVPAGSCGTNPLITSFTVSVADAAQGKLRLVPVGAPVVILGAAGKAGNVCDISLTLSVSGLPAIDADPATAGVQTHQSASAQAVHQSAGGGIVVESATGRDLTTVSPGATTTVPPQPPPSSPPPTLPALPPPPSQTPAAPANLDHFKCYEALQPNFRQRTVRLRDQFGERVTRVLRARQLCNPVSKDEGAVLHPRAHLVCYETRDRDPAFTQRTVLVTNQFGQRRLTVLRANRLCVPSLKRRGVVAPAGANPERVLDHFRCYDVRAQPASRRVTLRDQFGVTTSKVMEAFRLCNPVRKNFAPVRNARAHLVCYSIRDARVLRLPAIRVRNQFGRAALRVRAAQTLCVPSFKEVLQTTAPAAAPPGLDHFKCYVAEQPQLQPRNVGLRDQFGQFDAQVVKTRQLCNPVSKNRGRVLNRSAHLVCYETRDLGPIAFAPRVVRVSNQFGIRELQVVSPATLCIPSLKRRGAGVAPTGANPELVLDHFRCYDVKPLANPKTVKLADQFMTTKPKVLQVVRLCTPVRKNGTPVRRANAHLVCYSISEPPFQPLAVTVRNQFGVAALRVRTWQMLCLPSFKQIVTADGTVITNPR